LIDNASSHFNSHYLLTLEIEQDDQNESDENNTDEEMESTLIFGKLFFKFKIYLN
jgi:hypothetical protein